MDDSMANSTLSCDPSTNTSCIGPIDGFGGTLYSLQFSIPSYDPSNSNPTISLQDIDFYYQTRAQYLFVTSIGLGLCALTIANMLVLTPPHKRKFLHHVLLIGNVTELIRCSASASILMNGYLSSAYLALVDDWTSSDWTPGFRAIITVSDISICVSFACVEIAFYTLSHGILAWLRLKYPIYIYYVLITIMVFVSLFAYLWRVVFAIDEIRFFAFQPQGASLPGLLARSWYGTLEAGREISLAVSLGLWSAIFAISATIIIWERKKSLFWSENRGSGDCHTRSEKKKKVQSMYERTLRILGIVGVESFIIPFVICILNFVTENSNMPSTDGLIIPVMLALLPVLSLFNGGNIRAETDNNDAPRPNRDQACGTVLGFES